MDAKLSQIKKTIKKGRKGQGKESRKKRRSGRVRLDRVLASGRKRKVKSLGGGGRVFNTLRKRASMGSGKERGLKINAQSPPQKGKDHLISPKYPKEKSKGRLTLSSNKGEACAPRTYPNRERHGGVEVGFSNLGGSTEKKVTRTPQLLRKRGENSLKKKGKRKEMYRRGGGQSYPSMEN